GGLYCRRLHSGRNAGGSQRTFAGWQAAILFIHGFARKRFYGRREEYQFDHVDLLGPRPAGDTCNSRDQSRQEITRCSVEVAALSPIVCFVECGGFFSGVKFLEWIREKLAVKGIDENATLKSFAEQTGSDLSLVASDTSDREMLVLNHRTAPDCPVAWAVRMSMSIPFVWREVVWQDGWGQYLGRDKSRRIIVDGGVLSNFPIRLIDTEPEDDQFVKDVMGNTVASEAGTLGLLIDEKLEVEGAANTKKPPKLTGHIRTVQRVSNLVDTMTGAQDNDEIRRHEKDICRLPAKGYGTTEFDMTDDRLAALINAGRNAMKSHLGLA